MSDEVVHSSVVTRHINSAAARLREATHTGSVENIFRRPHYSMDSYNNCPLIEFEGTSTCSLYTGKAKEEQKEVTVTLPALRTERMLATAQCIVHGGGETYSNSDLRMAFIGWFELSSIMSYETL